MNNVQIKALVPQGLKRQAFAVLALQDRSLAAWIREEMERLVREASRQGVLTSQAATLVGRSQETGAHREKGLQDA